MFTEKEKKIPIIYYVISVKGKKLDISHPCNFSIFSESLSLPLLPLNYTSSY